VRAIFYTSPARLADSGTRVLDGAMGTGSLCLVRLVRLGDREIVNYKQGIYWPPFEGRVNEYWSWRWKV